MTLTGNEKFNDGLIRHNIVMKRRVGTVLAQVRKEMVATNKLIRKKYYSDMARGTPITSTQSAAFGYRDAMWGNILDIMRDFRNGVYKYETEYINRLAQRVYPIVMEEAPTRLYKKVREVQQANSPMRLSEPQVSMRTIAKLRVRDLSESKQIIIAAGELGWKPRMLSAALSRKDTHVQRHLQSIGLTQAKELSTQALAAFVEANSDIIDKVKWVATLDTRTMPECSALDGKEYPISEGPFPPQHYRCRCERVPIVSDLKGAVRPANPVSKKEAIIDFAKENNIKVPKLYKRSNLPYGYKTKFDKFLRKRLRERIGTVPATLDYETWLKRQSFATQEAAIGTIKRAKKFRAGEMTLADIAKETKRKHKPS